MRPYKFFNGNPGAMWIDLDHVLVIGEPYEPPWDFSKSRCIKLEYPQGVRLVDLLLAFRDQPLTLLLVGTHESRQEQYNALLIAWGQKPPEKRV